MIRILLVDDEVIFRMGLQSCIHWQENGFELVGEAANGRDALEKIEKLCPDIVLLDLKMPVMDGVETLRQALPAHPEICFIMLSCMNDYEYVRETMKIGAFDYLFKPVMDETSILQVMNEAKKKVLSSGRKGANAGPSLRQKQVEALQAFCLEAEPLPMELPLASCYDVVRIRLLLCKNDRYLLPTAQMLQIALTLLRSDNSPAQEAPFFLYSADSLLLLWPEEALPEKASRWFFEQFSLLCGGFAVMGCGDAPVALDSLHRALAQAERALDCAFFVGMGRCYRFSADEMQQRDFGEAYQVEYQQALSCAAEADAAGMQALLSQVTQDACEKHWFDKESLCHYAISLIIDSMRLYHQRIVVEDLFRDHYNMIAEIEKSEAQDEMLLRFSAVVAQLFRHLHSDEHSAYSPLIERIQRYLLKNYSSNISLVELADSVSMNSSYLCTLYKKETGKNLFTFLTETRIDAACRLLRKGDMKTFEVAQAVGYNDYRNFCRVFKRQTGTSPSHYRAEEGNKQT